MHASRETDALTRERDRLAARYPDWRFWPTSAGVLMASRRRDLSDEEVTAGLARTLPYGADDEELAEQLAEQARIEHAL